MSEMDLNHALDAHRRGDLAQAERGYRELIDGAERDAATARRMLGALLLQQSRDGEASAVLSETVELYPDDVESRSNLAIALRRCGRLEAAAEQAQLAVERAPERPSSWNALGLSLLDLGRFEAASATFEQALQRHPQIAAFHLHRGQALHGAQDLEGAERSYRAALELAQNSGEAWRGLARVQAQRANYREAIAAYQNAAALLGPEPALASEFGATLCAAGLHAQGQALLRGAVQSEPTMADAWYWLGRSLLGERKQSDAAAALARAAELRPDDAVVRHLLAAARGDTLEHVDRHYVRALYDDFADRFELTLRDGLGYSVPENLARLLGEQTNLRAARSLDLGCGTGLMGAALGALAGPLEGVDLSPRMLHKAAARGIYDALHEAEIVEFLHHSTQDWELIVVADVVIYLSDLRPLFNAAHARLAPGGWLALSAEAAAQGDIEVDSATARHRHGRDYLQRVLRETGFDSIMVRDTSIRREADAQTRGFLVLAQRPPDLDQG